MKPLSCFPFLLLLSTITACQSDKTLRDCEGNVVAVELPEMSTGGPLGLITMTEDTVIAIQSGNWSDVCVWSDGQLPSSNSTIIIPEGIEVTVDHEVDAEIETVGVYGKLGFSPDVDTELRVHTLVSSMTGTVEIGSQSSPISDNAFASIVFLPKDFADVDTMEIGRGAIFMGPTTMHGMPKTHRVTLDAPPQAGDTALALQTEPENWKIGDTIVIAGTIANDPESDEMRTITMLEGNIIHLDAPLELDHTAPSPDLEIHVANLSRNIQISSQSAELDKRGHLMFMHNGNVDIRHTKFLSLGRTNKQLQLDDWYFPELTAESAEPGPSTNQRGRYSVHFHRGGVAPDSPVAHVEGCVVEDDPGWAYVNHSSTVDFVNNVSYDVVGGAFQTEAGDEQGSFIGNIAIRTVNPDYPIENPDTEPVDIREDSQDFAFQGDGFWIHGGGVKLIDNVATGSSGHGFIFWTEGLREVDTPFDELNMFWVDNIPNGNLLDGIDAINAWWVPIAKFDGNRAYSTNKGFASYYVHSTLFEDIHDLSDTYLQTIHSTFSDLHLWNVGMNGIYMENCERFTFRDVRIENQNNLNASGIETRMTVGNRSIWDNVSVQGFEVGMYVPTQGDITIRGGTWSNLTDFVIPPPQVEPTRQGDNRDVRMENIRFEALPFSDTDELQNVKMVGAENLSGDWPTSNPEDAHRLIFIPDRIVLSSNLHEPTQLYFNEQDGNFTPVIEDIISSEASGSYLNAVVGKTNQQIYDEIGMSFAGRLTPDDAQVVDGVVGGVGAIPHGESMKIPACFFIDEPPPPADTFDTFNFYQCWDENGGITGEVEPYPHNVE